jgi:hypothetical protein
MGRFDVKLLDNDQLFQKLIVGIAPPGASVAADLDVNSFEEIPFITHFSTAVQDGNANGLWIVTLSVSLFDEPANAFSRVEQLYQGIWGWDDPTKGIVPGIGAIESIDQELSAFSRVGGEAQMENKTAIQYTGSWQLTARNH